MILSAVLILIVAFCLLYLAMVCFKLVTFFLENDNIFTAIFLALLGLGMFLGVADFAFREYRTLNPEPVAVEETSSSKGKA